MFYLCQAVYPLLLFLLGCRPARGFVFDVFVVFVVFDCCEFSFVYLFFFASKLANAAVGE